VVLPDGIVRADISIRDGRIAALTDDRDSPASQEEIDATGRIVLPGLIDPHVHMREPGAEEREDWQTGTAAAAAGGVTTVLEMPVSVPPTSTVDAFQIKRRIAEQKAVVDFGLYGGAGITNLEQIPRLAEAGAVAFKTFLHEPYPDRVAEFQGIYATDDGALLDIFRAVERTGLVQCVHAENNGIIEHRTRQLRAAGQVGPRAHGESRPVIAEVEAVSRTMLLAAEAGVRLNLCHVSSASAVEVAEEYRRRRRARVTIETCPQYLLLNEEDVVRLGPYAKISPPIRSEPERARLWGLFAAGVVDTIGTDHAPHVRAAKERGWADIFEAPAGAPGLETMLPLLLTRVAEGALTLEALANVASARAARLFGLHPRKGGIRVGADADLVVVDLERTQTLDSARMYTKQREAAKLFHGRKVQGVPVMTLVRGQVVMRDGEVVGAPGHGRLVRPIVPGAPRKEAGHE